MADLLNCPFCEGEARIVPGDFYTTAMHGVGCVDCGAYMEGLTDTAEASFAAWNRRQPSQDARDAARYRWLRDASGMNCAGWLGWVDVIEALGKGGKTAAEIDAAIDAAMGE